MKLFSPRGLAVATVGIHQLQLITFNEVEPSCLWHSAVSVALCLSDIRTCQQREQTKLITTELL